jgi:hypothetical protein
MLTSSSSPSSRLLPSTLQMLVNGTSVDRSLASYDRFQWLEDQERSWLHKNHSLLSIELLAEIQVQKPGYVHIFPSTAKFSSATTTSSTTLNRRNNHRGKQGDFIYDSEASERLWVTGFSMTQSSGEVHFIDIHNAHVGKLQARTRDSIRWPNEVTLIPRIEKHSPMGPKVSDYEDALLIADGFLVPGKDQGGIYVVLRPGHSTEWKVCLTGGQGMDGLLSKLEDQENIGSWFYHKAAWVDLTGDGRLSVLTARCSRVQMGQDTGSSPSFSSFRSQLVFLERPKPYKYDKDTGTPLDIDGLVFDPFSTRHTPWKTQ